MTAAGCCSKRLFVVLMRVHLLPCLFFCIVGRGSNRASASAGRKARWGLSVPACVGRCAARASLVTCSKRDTALPCLFLHSGQRLEQGIRFIVFPLCARLCLGADASSARFTDLKFTFPPAGADDSVLSKAPLPRRGAVCLRADWEFFEPILFFLFQKEKNGFNLPRRERVLCKTGGANRTAIASEEASSIPFPPGRRKLHIRSLLLPSQIVTVSLGHNLAIWNFTTPHAVLMMAGT